MVFAITLALVSPQPKALQAAPIALPAVVPCRPSLPCPSSRPCPSSAACPGCPVGSPVPEGPVLTGSAQPGQGSPPARAHPHLSALPAVLSPHSLSGGTPAGRNSPKAPAAFRGAMPGPGSPGHCPPWGLLLALAALEGPAQRRAGARSGYGSGEEHLHVSAKIINSALEFLTWQQSPRRREWLLRVPAGTAREARWPWHRVRGWVAALRPAGCVARGTAAHP